VGARAHAGAPARLRGAHRRRETRPLRPDPLAPRGGPRRVVPGVAAEEEARAAGELPAPLPRPAGGPRGSLAAHLSVADRLDCEFLLAEEYERQHRDEDAFALYSRIYEEDERYRYFRHFRQEILLRMRNIVVRFLWSDRSLPQALRGFSGALKDVLNKRDRAFMYKKMAECFLMAGDESSARLNLLAAFQLHPGLAGVKKIRTRLGMNRRSLAAADS